MKRGIKVRIAAFLVLSAVGIVYVAGSYLGLVDRVLGRGFTVHATLPSSGGLFEGSEVTYRGVKIGEVDAMDVTRDGLRLDLALKEGTELPLDSAMYVHNLSAVGEQYLDFEPQSGKGPYAGSGDTIEGNDGVAARRRGGPADRAGPVRVLGRPRQPRGHGPRARADVQRHRRPAAEAPRQRRQVHRRGLRPRGRDGRAARERPDRPAHPARRGREHPDPLPRPEPDHPVAAAQ